MFGSGEGKGGLGGSGKDKEVGNKMELGKEEKKYSRGLALKRVKLVAKRPQVKAERGGRVDLLVINCSHNCI